MDPKLKIMIIAAEPSGDVLGAGLIHSLRIQSDREIEFSGIGGARMKALGIDSPFDIGDLAILGMAEGLKAFARVKARVADSLIFVQTIQPDVVILIDSWGFTLRVAKAIRASLPNIKLIKYVAPQVWATRPGRAKTLAKQVDLLLALHPMDAPYFEAEGLKTIVVGNPALNLDFSGADPSAFRKKYSLNTDDQLLLVLPGSRPAEIKRLLPVFLETIQRLVVSKPNLKTAIVIAEAVADSVKSALDNLGFQIVRIQTDQDKLSAMKLADLALACSGTVSTELALAGCPMVIAYRVEPITYWIFKYLSPLKFVTLFNIIANKGIAPEFIQNACTSENLSGALLKRLTDENYRKTQIIEQNLALEKMGRGQKPPAERAALAILDFMKSN